MKLTSGNLFLKIISNKDLDFICQIECDRELWQYEESVETDLDTVWRKYSQRLADKAKPKRYDFLICL